MLAFFDIFYSIIHLLLVVFNLFGWIPVKTRKLHLITLAVTAASWFILGIWYGWGYCPITDWHWAVKEKLGETNLPNSFIKYYADKIFRADINPSLIDAITLTCLIFAVVASIWVNFIMPLRRKKSAE